MADARLAKAKALLTDDAPVVSDGVALAPTDDTPAAPAVPLTPEPTISPEHKAAQDKFISLYVDPPPAPVTQPAGEGGAGNTPTEPAPPAQTDGTGTQSAGEASEPTPAVDQVKAADAEAAKRAEFNKLNASRSAGADARLAQGAQGRAVLVAPGGMRPESDTTQVTQGPEVNDAERLLHNVEYNATRAAGDNATAEKARDTTLAGLTSDYEKGSNTLAVADQKAKAKQSDALGNVASRMQAAIDASQVPVVSPAADLNAMGMGQKLAFALAAAGGGIASRGTGGNAFLDGYNQMVDARIKTQESQAKQKGDYAKGQENLYGVMRQGFESDDAARLGVRMMYTQALDTKLKEAALHYNIDAANPNYMRLQASIAQQLLTDQEELAKIQGTHVSEQKTEKYAPPQVAVVGGPNKGDAQARSDLDKYWTDHKLYDKESDLDTLNNIVRTADKSGVLAKYVAAHPNMSYANAYFAARSDPQQRQLLVDVDREVKDNIAGSGMRSELGQQLGKNLSNVDTALQTYSRLGHDYQNEAASGIAAHGGFDAYRRWRAESQDIQDATNSPVRAEGAEPLPKALPEQTHNLPPAAPHPIVAAYEGKKSHHKKAL